MEVDEVITEQPTGTTIGGLAFAFNMSPEEINLALQLLEKKLEDEEVLFEGDFDHWQNVKYEIGRCFAGAIIIPWICAARCFFPDYQKS